MSPPPHAESANGSSKSAAMHKAVVPLALSFTASAHKNSRIPATIKGHPKTRNVRNDSGCDQRNVKSRIVTPRTMRRPDQRMRFSIGIVYFFPSSQKEASASDVTSWTVSWHRLDIQDSSLLVSFAIRSGLC